VYGKRHDFMFFTGEERCSQSNIQVEAVEHSGEQGCLKLLSGSALHLFLFVPTFLLFNGFRLAVLL